MGESEEGNLVRWVERRRGGTGGAVDGGERGKRKTRGQSGWMQRDAGVRKATPDSMTVAAIVDSDDVHVESVPQSACFFTIPPTIVFFTVPAPVFFTVSSEIAGKNHPMMTGPDDVHDDDDHYTDVDFNAFTNSDDE